MLVALTAIAVSCGLPSDSSPRDVGPQFLLDPNPSSTVTPVVPSASAPRAYFLSGPPDQPGTLLPEPRSVEASGTAVIQALFDGLTTAEQSHGLRTAIPEGTELIEARLLPDGTARINVTDAIVTASRNAQVEAVAQIVFTATGAPGASQVELLVDGKPKSWSRGDGSLEDGPLTRFMFPALNPSTRPDYPPVAADGGPVATTAPSTSVPEAGR
ncbi:MAG TPA: GerMN domain-containing protein [Acidimicrobiales bacterium]